LTSIEATLRKHDEKVRLAPVVAQRRLGLGGPWRAIPVLVLPESGGARRRLAAHASVLDRAYPLRGRELTTRLRARRGLDRLGGVLLLPVTRDMGAGRAAATPHRVPRSR
ncbi:MAG TPA: hypothetical protein VFX65_13575, partial [Candidatus Limnocylindrales bacterium]|nr:hypothetical protein [Candidatus Limnocylindrales bacterium]